MAWSPVMKCQHFHQNVQEEILEAHPDETSIKLSVETTKWILTNFI
jgi:hypothetical protein